MALSASRPLTSTAAHPPMGSAVAMGAARLFTTYLRRVARTARLRCIDVGGGPLDVATMVRALAPTGPDGRPIVMVYWGADAIAVAALPFLEPAFVTVARGLTFLFDETFGGHVCASLVAELGVRRVMLDRPKRPERLEQLQAVMRRGGSYAFAVDGGGPYFQVGSGVATLARTLKARIVPLAVLARPAIPWVHPSRITFPLPRCRMTAALGDPIDALAGGREAIRAILERTLAALRRSASDSRGDA
jgi:lysophospholipid acyltransferase (LPLAT)-like uncharacterized protein